MKRGIEPEHHQSDHKKKQGKKPAPPGASQQNSKGSSEKPETGENYWDRISEDPASGYKTKEDESAILNNDQVQGDNERGDTASNSI